MALPNAIGLSDSVKTFTAPANLAPVHSPGDTWARQGRTDADTSRIGVAEWNYIIGSFRGVINFTPGFDPSARDVDDPTLLRDAITAFSTAKIIELLPDAVLDQAPALAAEMTGTPAFVAAVAAAVPLNLNASNLTLGTVPDARLQVGSRHASASIADLNVLINAYRVFAAAAATGYPAGDSLSWVESVVQDNGANKYGYQIANGYVDPFTHRYVRKISASLTWGAWEEAVPLALSTLNTKNDARNDTRYARSAYPNTFSAAQSFTSDISVKYNASWGGGALVFYNAAVAYRAVMRFLDSTDTLQFVHWYAPANTELQCGVDGVWKVGTNTVHHGGIAALVAKTTGATPYYGARAWVHFNGTGTVAIRSSANVSSITDNGTGDYTVNFTTAMPDAEYATLISLGSSGAQAIRGYVDSTSAPTTSAVRIKCTSGASILTDFDRIAVAIMR